GRIIKGAAEKVGIKENVATHSLRKTFARHIYDEEENKTYALELIRKILGHKTIEMTRRYIGIDKDEEVKAITKFTNKLKKRKRN
ncbi:tyrosine-type recombinase/integrase, partial [Clostridioides difficile]|uniref:tyrosine-type recombinase/integrase n=3 Tax=Clostridioides TaxID=1870884 RepID=UPI001CA57DC9